MRFAAAAGRAKRHTGISDAIDRAVLEARLLRLLDRSHADVRRAIAAACSRRFASPITSGARRRRSRRARAPSSPLRTDPCGIAHRDADARAVHDRLSLASASRHSVRAYRARRKILLSCRVPGSRDRHAERHARSTSPSSEMRAHRAHRAPRGLAAVSVRGAVSCRAAMRPKACTSAASPAWYARQSSW